MPLDLSPSALYTGKYPPECLPAGPLRLSSHALLIVHEVTGQQNMGAVREGRGGSRCVQLLDLYGRCRGFVHPFLTPVKRGAVARGSELLWPCHRVH